LIRCTSLTRPGRITGSFLKLVLAESGNFTDVLFPPLTYTSWQRPLPRKNVFIFPFQEFTEDPS
jgi:hypothetical protein